MVLKANMRIDKIFMSSVNAGMILSFACASHLSIQSSPWFQDNAAGLIRALGALVFPYGLAIIILTGSDLCMGSFMYTTLAVVHRRLSVWKMLIHWVITFLGNLAGALFVVSIITGYGGTFDTAYYRTESINFAISKQITPMWHQIFLRAIGANWLVCLACYLGLSGKEFVSKVTGIWWPIFAFVSLGFDHVVANMWFIPNGIWHKTPGLTVGLYIWKGIIPAALGNIIGGGLFVACMFWYLHLYNEAPIAIDGVYYEQIPSGALHPHTEDHLGVDDNDKRRSTIEDRV